jgi:hypothetical protein
MNDELICPLYQVPCPGPRKCAPAVYGTEGSPPTAPACPITDAVDAIQAIAHVLITLARGTQPQTAGDAQPAYDRERVLADLGLQPGGAEGSG